MERCVRAYLHRFDIEYGFRFKKGPWGGRRHLSAPPSRPTAGPVSSSPATPSSDWPAASPAISGFPGSAPRPAARNPGAGPQGVSSTSLGDRHSSQSTEIDRGGSGTSKGDQSGPSHSLPRGQEGGLRARRRFKCKLGILMQCGRVSIRPTRRAGQGCLAALGRAGGEPDPRGCRWPRARCRYGRVLHA